MHFTLPAQLGSSKLYEAPKSISGVFSRKPQAPRRSASDRPAQARGQRAVTVAQATASAGVSTPAPRAGIDWDNLGFNINNAAPHMFTAHANAEGQWEVGKLSPYGPMPMFPSAQVLNYGQSIFEGMKAQRAANGKIVIFRPDMNAQRMHDGALRMCMPPVPKDLFLRAINEVVRANADYVPPQGKGSLYLRPLLMGTGPILGLGPAPAYTFLIYAAPVGAYFKGGQLTPIDLVVETKGFHRAAPGGMGGTKAAGNYSPVLITQLAAKKQGYADVVYLDAKEDKYLEEVSSCNIFVVKGKTIKTPPLGGTILPGVTRRSIIELARQRGYTVDEVPTTVDDAMDADEIFTTGTAVVVSAVGSLTYGGKKKQFGEVGKPCKVALEMYENLTGIQTLKFQDSNNWVQEVI